MKICWCGMRKKDEYVTCRINDDSKNIVDYDECFTLICKGEKINNITIITPPKYISDNEKDSRGATYSSYSAVHIDRARVSPISGCINDCLFCDLNKQEYIKKDINILKEGLDKAIENTLIKNILISGGSPKRQNEEYNYLNEVYRFFGENFKKVYKIEK